VGETMGIETLTDKHAFLTPPPKPPLSDKRRFRRLFGLARAVIFGGEAV